MNFVFLGACLVVVACAEPTLHTTEEASVEVGSSPLFDTVPRNDLGPYSINFPSNPQSSEEYLPFEDGEMTVWLDTYTPSVDTFYAVKRTMYPQELFEEKDTILAIGILNNAIENLKAQYQISNIEVEESRNVSGYPGVFFKGDNGIEFTTVWYIMVNNELYQIILSQKGVISERQVVEFFDSFVLHTTESNI